jgi:DNA modification methylase
VKLRKPKPLPIWPSARIEHWPLEHLKPSPVNSRLHSKADVAAVAASMARWGITQPVLADEKGGIISGHCRLLAGQKLGLTTLPVVVARGWTEAEKRAYCIADNQLAARATWDLDVLKRELQFLDAAGFELPLIGFDDEDLKALLVPLGQVGIGDPDAEIEPPADPVSQLGDIWKLGRHRVVCGDCTDAKMVAAALGKGGGKTGANLMVTDPPYGVNYDPAWRQRADKKKARRAIGKVLNDHQLDWGPAWKHFKGDVAYVWHAGLFGGRVSESLAACNFEIRSQIVWAKTHFALGRGDYHWQHECCLYAVRKGAKRHWRSDRKQTTLWQVANNTAISGPGKERSWGHGTQKPVEVMRRPIEHNSSPGDGVYDPFLGSGSTLIAAEMTGRACFGLELSPAYVDVIVRRWSDFTGQEATLGKSGKTFAATARARGKAGEDDDVS